MTRSDLIDAVAKHEGVSRRTATVAVDCVLNEIREALIRGERVEIRGFGTFRARYYPAYTGRNPRTGEGVAVPAKVQPVFRPGRALRTAVGAGSEHREEEP